MKLRGGVEQFTPTGVRFADGTGRSRSTSCCWPPASAPRIGFLGPLVRTDDRGFGMRRDRVVSIDQPNLFFVGHNYDATGGLTNIRRDAPLAAQAVGNTHVGNDHRHEQRDAGHLHDHSAAMIKNALPRT